MTEKDTKEEKILKEIKSEGYWEVNIHPIEHKSNLIDEKELRDLMNKTSVSLRGWTYPVYGINRLRPHFTTKGIENWFSNSGNHVEIWRMTTSGNFFHLKKFPEDGYDSLSGYIKSQIDDGDKWLGVFNTLYTLTEIFEFASRLSKTSYYSNIVVDINVYGLKNRRFVVDSPRKHSMFTRRICHDSGPWNYNKEFHSVNNLQKKHSQFSLEAFEELAILFQWENPPVESLKSDQRKFLEGKF